MPSGGGARLRQWLIAASISGIWMAGLGGWGGGGGGRGLVGCSIWVMWRGDSGRWGWWWGWWWWWKMGSPCPGVMRSSGHIQGAQPGARHFTGTGAQQGLRKGNAPRQFASHRRHGNAPRQCAMTWPAVAPAPGLRSTNGFTAGTGGPQLHGAVDADELHQPLGHD